MYLLDLGIISSVQSLSCVWLFVTPWTAARQASLSIINSWSLLKLMSIESVMPSSHLILCHPFLLPPSIFPSIRVFPVNQWPIRWPKYWSFSFSTGPSSEYSGLISFRIDWLDLRVRESIPRQVDEKSRGPQGERGLEFSRRKKGQTFSPLHSLGLYNNNASCLRTVSGKNLLASPVILKCKLWEWA